MTIDWVTKDKAMNEVRRSHNHQQKYLRKHHQNLEHFGCYNYAFPMGTDYRFATLITPFMVCQ